MQRGGRRGLREVGGCTSEASVKRENERVTHWTRSQYISAGNRLFASFALAACSLRLSLQSPLRSPHLVQLGGGGGGLG